MKYLLAVFMLHENNCRCLHWLSCGKAFDRAHQIAEDLRSLISDDIDTIAEMSLRIDDSGVANLPETIGILKESDENHIIVDSNKCYEKKDVEKLTGVILEDILNTIEIVYKDSSMEDIRNVGIKSALESLYDKYDKEYRYLSKRRSIEND